MGKKGGRGENIKGKKEEKKERKKGNKKITGEEEKKKGREGKENTRAYKAHYPER